MSFLEFLSAIINSLAWPMTLLALVLLFKQKILDSLSLIEHFKYKDLEVKFSEKVKRLDQESARPFSMQEVDAPTQDALSASIEVLSEKLKDMALISPVAAIMEAWVLLEIEIVNAFIRMDFMDEKPSYLTPIKKVLEKLEKEDLEYPDSFDEHYELLDLKNMAVHLKEFEISEETAIAYCRVATNWIAYWKGFTKGYSEFSMDNEEQAV